MHTFSTEPSCCTAGREVQPWHSVPDFNIDQLSVKQRETGEGEVGLDSASLERLAGRACSCQGTTQYAPDGVWGACLGVVHAKPSKHLYQNGAKGCSLQQANEHNEATVLQAVRRPRLLAVVSADSAHPYKALPENTTSTMISLRYHARCAQRVLSQLLASVVSNGTIPSRSSVGLLIAAHQNAAHKLEISRYFYTMLFRIARYMTAILGSKLSIGWSKKHIDLSATAGPAATPGGRLAAWLPCRD